MGMSWIISSNGDMKYEIDKSNHQYWLNTDPWYNTDIFSRLHVSMFEDFITNARIDRYSLICSLVSHDKKLPAYKYDDSSIGDNIIPKHVTIEALEALSDTLDFIDIWLKLLEENYDSRRVAYITAMKEMFKKIPLTTIKSLSPKQKPRNYDRNWWWMVY